jgi:hypothetical protein
VTTATLPDKVEVVVSCACDCACHQRKGSKVTKCRLIIEDGQEDCANDCRGKESSVVCDPFIWRTE